MTGSTFSAYNYNIGRKEVRSDLIMGSSEMQYGKRNIIYLETGSTDPYYNLAFEEYVLRQKKEGDYLILWQNDNTIVIGQNQNTEAEINRAFVDEHKINVVRRTTGGGAVYHDLGNLNYSFITDVGDAAELSIKWFTGPVVKALAGLGVEAEASGRNDIVVSGKKVSGTAQRIAGGRILHHGTLLFDSDPGLLAGALNADPDKFISKSAKSVKSRVGNIKDMLPEAEKDMSIDEFKMKIREELAAAGFEEGALSESDLEEVRKLKAEKYDTWEWNYGRSPKFDIENRKRLDGGTLEVRTSVAKKGVIEDIVFFGDFLSVESLDGLVEDLKGCRFDRGEVTSVLAKHPVSRYFGAISAEEVLAVMFGDV